MSRFFKRILCFILPLFLIWIIAYVYFEKYIKLDTYEIFKQDEILESSPNKFQYLIAGHSRLDRAIDTDLLPSSFKITKPDENYIGTYLKLKYILENTNKKFETIILPFGKGTFKNNDINKDIFWIKTEDYFKIGNQRNELGIFIDSWLLTKCFPFLEYYKKEFKSLFANEKKEIIIDKENGQWSDLKKVEQDQLIQEHLNILNEIGIVDRTAKYYIQQTILLAEKYDVQIVYINAPLTNEYIKALETIANHNMTHNDLEKYAESFEHVKVLDMENIFLEQDSLFSDQHHLNIKGKEIFTSELIDIL